MEFFPFFCGGWAEGCSVFGLRILMPVRAWDETEEWSDTLEEPSE